MSGAAVVDAGGLGTSEIEAMKKAGCDTEFSVGQPFAAGFVPGR